MRFFFMGSVPNHIPGSDQPSAPRGEALFEAAQELGYKAALRRHTIMLGSDSPRTVDYHVAQGLFACCRAHPDATFSLEIHCPEGGDLPYTQHPENLTVTTVTHPGEDGAHRWMITHLQMMHTCDAIMTLGGGQSTKTIGLHAIEMEKPYVIPIAWFGGASKELYNVVRYEYSRFESLPDKGALACINARWDKDNADRIIGLTEAIVSTGLERPPGFYFISYNRKDNAAADEIELFLRRRNRKLLRDEEEIMLGAPVSKTLQEKINQSDTFIALVSKHYLDSDWCMGELTHAVYRKRAGGPPGRVILLLIEDNVQPPLLQADALHRRAVSRTDRENAIMRIISEEK